FSGPRAARISGHVAISIATTAAGLVAIGLAARFYRWAADRSPRALAAGLALLAIGADLANRLVLPRLYGWFHATLSVLTLALFVLAARLRLHGSRRRAVAAALAAVGAWSFAPYA